MPAIRLLDTEHQTELAYLHEQLIEGEPVQDKSWRYAEEYLMQLGIYNVILVEENDVRNYKRFLLEDRDCTIRAANSMTSFLRNKKAYWIEQEYGDLLEEIRQCEGIEMPLTGNIKNFLIREGIHHIREIDYSIREKYEQYLMKEKKPEQVLRYLKTLDRIKQYHIRQEMKQFANIKKFYLKYEQQILFLPYLPDQKLAMEFDKVRDKTELVWDFSVKASEKMKQQIFQLLIHILENVKDPKDRRVRFLLPMQWMYQYCIKQGIVDIETIEQEEIEKLEEIVKQKVVNYKNSMQIVDNSRKILFMSGKQIHWHANVWYMERFHLAPERVNPCNPVTLVAGRKVPLVKSKENWKLKLSELLNIGEQGIQDVDQDTGEGLTYRDYLKGLLILQDKETLSMRALDLIEQNLDLKADNCVMRIEIESKCKLRRGVQYEFSTYFGYQ